MSRSAHVEHVLGRWCDLLHTEWKLSEDPKAFVKKSKKKHKWETTARALVRYLHEIAGLAVAEFETWPEWTRFDAYWGARNCIVHDGGIIVDGGVRKKIETLEYIEVDESELLLDAPAVVHLLPGACEDAAETAKKLIERLNTACEVDPRAKRP